MVDREFWGIFCPLFTGVGAREGILFRPILRDFPGWGFAGPAAESGVPNLGVEKAQ